MKREESSSKRYALLSSRRFRLAVDNKELLLKRVAMKVAGIEGVPAKFHNPLTGGRNCDFARLPASP